MDCAFRPPSTTDDHIKDLSHKLARVQAEVEQLGVSSRSMQELLSKSLQMQNDASTTQLKVPDQTIEKQLGESHSRILQSLLQQHQHSLKLIEDSMSDFVRKQEFESKCKGQPKYQEKIDLEEVFQSQLAVFQEKMSASIVAEVLDKLPERLEGAHVKDEHFTEPSQPVVPIATKTSFSEEQHPTSSASAEDADAGEVEIDVTTSQEVPLKAPDRMHMADTAGKLPHIELEEDSSLTGIFGNDTDVCKPMHKVEDYYWKSGMAQEIARSNLFAHFTIFVVLLNAIYLAVDSDLNDAANIYDADWPFQLATQFFCLYFTMELLIRFVAFEHKNDCLRDGWFKFDAFLVSTMILDVWIIMAFLKVYEGAGSVRIPTQPLRMLRLFKLTRMARLMKAFPELMTMIKGLVQSLRATASSMVLLLVLVYSEAILFHLLLKDEKEYNAKLHADWGYEFSSIGHCMWTLLMAGTLMLDNSSPLMTELLFNDRLVVIIAGLLFITFTFISALLILQMLIGVLCDVVSQINAARRDATAVGLVKQELMGYLNSIDIGKDGIITKWELMPMFEQQNALALFRKLNINRSFFHKLSDLTFHDQSARVPIRTILELLLMCRGDNPVNVNILASTIFLLINYIGEVTSNMNAMQYRTHVVRKPSRQSHSERPV